MDELQKRLRLQFLAQNGDSRAAQTSRVEEVQDFRIWRYVVSGQPQMVRAIVAFEAAKLVWKGAGFSKFLGAVRGWLKKPSEATLDHVKREYMLVDQMSIQWMIDYPGQGNLYAHLYYLGLTITRDEPYDCIHVLNSVAREMGEVETMAAVKEKLIKAVRRRDFSASIEEFPIEALRERYGESEIHIK